MTSERTWTQEIERKKKTCFQGHCSKTDVSFGRRGVGTSPDRSIHLPREMSAFKVQPPSRMVSRAGLTGCNRVSRLQKTNNAHSLMMEMSFEAESD